MPRLAVIGHVVHVTLARVASLPDRGAIVHADDACWIPGGGGGVAFHQLVQSPAEVHFFTALGDDAIGHAVAARVGTSGGVMHAARRPGPHSRDVALVTPDGERTIVVLGDPLHPRADDDLPWHVLEECDAVFFTAHDPALLRAARRARVLVVAARRAEALAASEVQADVVVGSHADPKETTPFADYRVPPYALVLTEGARGGTIETRAGVRRFPATPVSVTAGSYGAGDTFAAALTWFLAEGLDVLEACTRASVHGAAAVRGLDPLAHHRPLALV